MAGMLRSGAGVSLLTLCSRVLGFVRDASIAQSLGAGPVAEAFVVAFRIPNLCRRLLADGVLSQGLVPLLVAHQGSASEGSRLRVRVWLWRVLEVALPWLLLAPFLVPLVAAALAPGFAESPGRQALVVELLYWMWPYAGLVALAAVLAAALQANGQFAALAVGPMLLNLSMLAGLFLGLALGGQGHGLAVTIALSVTLGGALQLGWFTFCWTGAPPPREPARPALDEAATVPASQRLSPTQFLASVLAASVAQCNLLVATAIGSWLVPGSLAWLYYADRLVEFPLGLVASALGMVLLPELAAAAAAGDRARWSMAVDTALHLTLLAALPATLGLWALSGPTVIALFQYGAMAARDATEASFAVAAYALSILPLCLGRVLLPALITRVSVRALLLCSLAVLLVHAVAALLLAQSFLGHAGIALATTLAAVVQVLLYGWVLARQGYHPGNQGCGWWLRPLFAALFMTLVLMLLAPALPVWLEGSAGWRLSRLLGIMLAGAFAYLLGLHLLGFRWAMLRPPRSPATP